MSTIGLACFLLMTGDPPPLEIEPALLTVAEQAEVPSRDAGIIAEIGVREGQSVRSGESLVRLDDAEARLAAARARAELERARKLAVSDIKIRAARKELEYATAEYARACESEAALPGSVTGAERERLELQQQRAALDLAQTELDQESAKLAVPVFENDWRVAEERLSRRRITAPISGTVVVVARRLGEWVEPGQMVVRVLATEKLRVEVLLDAEQARPGLVGQTVRFQPDGERASSESFPGRVAFVSPEVDPYDGQVRMWAEIDNSSGQLRPGQSGTLVIPR